MVPISRDTGHTVWHVPVATSAPAAAAAKAPPVTTRPTTSTHHTAPEHHAVPGRHTSSARPGSGGTHGPGGPADIGAVRLRLFRLHDGRRCAVGFSSARALAELLGPEQASAELSESALRALTAPLGVDTLVLDPRLAPPTSPGSPSTRLQHG